MRTKSLIAILFGTLMLTACAGIVNESTTTGTIERVDRQYGGFPDKKTVLFTLVGTTTVYECWGSEINFCQLLEPGDEIEVTAGVNKDYSELENFVTSATPIASAG